MRVIKITTLSYTVVYYFITKQFVIKETAFHRFYEQSGFDGHQRGQQSSLHLTTNKNLRKIASFLLFLKTAVRFFSF